ncbi:MAG: signal recognition particle-docking protein FtsY [Verrucomicrobiota bacterium]
MKKWFKALTNTREKVTGALTKVFTRSDAVDEDTVEELEELLLGADISMTLISEWLMELEKPVKGQSRRERLRELLRNNLMTPEPPPWSGENKPATVLIVGTNGSGKTTTCAKLAWMVQQEGLKPLLAAGDTFRAAGSDQLKIWADTVGSDVVAGETGADAAAVAYDALSAAISRNADVLFVDTAGRMHTKNPLMQELEKVHRAMKKRLDSAPDEIWIVLDASLGQNAIIQAKTFNETVPLSGIVVTKLDGSSKAGFIFSILQELKTPIQFVGLGEAKEDLVPFDPDEFLEALLGKEEEEPALEEPAL